MELTARHRKALEALRYECDYEDSRVGGDQNFIRWEQVLNAGGSKTRADLVQAGYAVNGPYRWADGIGQRITQSGRAALNTSPQQKSTTPKRKLQQVPPRLGKAPSRL